MLDSKQIIYSVVCVFTQHPNLLNSNTANAALNRSFYLVDSQ